MKKYFFAVVLVVLVAGCQSTNPLALAGAADAPERAEQMSSQKRGEALQQTMAELQRAMDAQAKAQQKTQSKLTAAYDELHATALGIKAIKDRIDALQSQQQTNSAAIARLQEKMKAAALESKQIEAQLSGVPARMDDLQRKLEKETSEHRVADEIARQREKEIADLRRALATQQSLLKDNKKSVAADKAQPPVEAQPGGQGAHEDANKWVAQANNLLAAGKAEDAQTLFEAALKSRPAMVPALVGLAACQYARNDFLEAAKTADRVLDMDGQNAQALGVKGLVYRKEGSLSAAGDTLARAVKADPHDARLHNYYGIVLSDRKRSGEAIEQFRKAAELDPGYAEANFNLAFLLATDAPPQIEEARRAYEKAVSLGAEHDAELDRILGGSK